MISRENFLPAFRKACDSMWTKERRLKLSRIAVHERQYEKWWQLELATHLWDFVGTLQPKVMVYTEVMKLGQVDLVIATPGPDIITPNLHGPICVPIELKVSGTYWQDSKKAFSEDGKKSLSKDFATLVGIAKSNQGIRPCGLVGLLITDISGNKNNKYEEFRSAAMELANENGLGEVMDTTLDLPPPKFSSEFRPVACQLFWPTK